MLQYGGEMLGWMPKDCPLWEVSEISVGFLLTFY